MKIIKILVCLLLLLPAVSTFGGNDSNKVPFRQKGTNRPSDTNDDENVSCSFTQGQLRIFFHEPEGPARFTIVRFEDGDTRSTTFVTTHPFYYYVGTEPGTYTLNIKTAKNEYEGLLEIQ